jgi:flagellar hook assembly protein FlgD
LFEVGPNPVTGATRVSYALARAGAVSLSVYDATGRQVRNLVSGTLKAGVYAASWDGRDAGGRQVPAGVYYVRLSADRASTARVTVVR